MEETPKSERWVRTAADRPVYNGVSCNTKCAFGKSSHINFNFFFLTNIYYILLLLTDLVIISNYNNKLSYLMIGLLQIELTVLILA